MNWKTYAKYRAIETGITYLITLGAAAVMYWGWMKGSSLDDDDSEVEVIDEVDID